MSRASFGGASDYSDLFASVYGNSTGTGSGNPDIAAANKLQYEFDSGAITAAQYSAGLAGIAQQYAGGVNDQKYYQYMSDSATAATRTATIQKQAEAEAKALQSANDSDMQSQWQSGVVSNDEWLAYVRSRADGSTEPKEQAKWSGYYLKFKEQIGDSTAEYAFEMGGSISDLIAYYQTKIAGKDPSAQDTQKDQLRLNDLIDTRVSQNVSDGVQRLLDAIDAGTATYDDLLKFEKEALASARPNSDMEKQLRAEIEKVEDQIKQNVSEGVLGKAEYDFKSKKLTGKAYAAIIEAEAAQYKTSDPSKYYQFMTTAYEYRTKNPGLYGAGGGSGRKPATAHDLAQAVRSEGEWYIQQYNEGVREVSGPNGRVALTPSFIAAWDKKIAASYDADIAYYNSRGEPEEAADAASRKLEYINNNVIPHNTMPIADRDAHVATARQTQLALYEGAIGINAAGKYAPSGYADPIAASHLFNQWLAQDAAALAAASRKTVTSAHAVERERNVTTVPGALKTGMDAISPGYVAASQAVNAALRVANNPASTPEQIDAAGQALTMAFPNKDGSGFNAPDYLLRTFDVMAQNSENLAGAQTGARVLVLNVQGVPAWVDTAPRSYDEYGETGKVTGKALEPVMSQAGLVSDGKGTPQKVVDLILDLNGVPTHIKGIASQSVSDLLVWTAGKNVTIALGGKGGTMSVKAGDVLTHDQLAKLDKHLPDWRNQESTDGLFRTVSSEGAYYKIVVNGATDKNGKLMPAQTWTQDPGTKQWVRGEGIGLKHVERETDGTVRVNADGRLAIDYNPDSGFVVPYAGVNLIGAQKVLNSDGTIDTSGIGGRDLNGNYTEKPFKDPAISFYDPAGPNYMKGASKDDEDPILALAKQRKQAATTFRRDELLKANFDRTDPQVLQSGVPSAVRGDAAIKDYGTKLGLNFGASGAASLLGAGRGTLTNPPRAGTAGYFTPPVSGPSGGTLTTPPVSGTAGYFTPATSGGFTPRYSPATYSGPTLPPVTLSSLKYMAGASKDDSFVPTFAPVVQKPYTSAVAVPTPTALPKVGARPIAY